MPGVRATVVILTLDRAEYLRKLLIALERQTFPTFEVVVVQGPCSDNTDSVLKEYAGRVKVVRTQRHNISHARNLGVQAAAGGVIAFIDDDAEPMATDWLEKLAAPIAQGETDIVGGGVQNAHTRTWESYVSWTSVYAVQKRCLPGDTAPTPARMWQINAPGGNAAWRSDTLRRLGGFDETYGRYLDETDACRRAQVAGARILVLPEIGILHHLLPGPQRDDRDDFRLDVHLRSQVYFAIKTAPDSWPLRATKAVAVCLPLLARLTMRYVRHKTLPFLLLRVWGLWTAGVARGLCAGLLRPRKLCDFARCDEAQPFLPFMGARHG